MVPLLVVNAARVENAANTRRRSNSLIHKLFRLGRKEENVKKTKRKDRLMTGENTEIIVIIRCYYY